LIAAKTIKKVETKFRKKCTKGLDVRGSVYYQSAQLAKQIFCEGAKKLDRVNPEHPHYQKVASYKTMESYRKIWNNLFNYLLEHWKLKDFEQIDSHHIQSYMDYKIEYYPSKQYLEKINSAIGKLEIALKHFSINIHGQQKEYNFNIRQNKLNEARDLKIVASNYHNRAYNNPTLLIQNLKNPIHQLSASMQYEGGARIEGVALIKESQLKGYKFDSISKKDVGIIETKEKGGKVGDVLISLETYNTLASHFAKNKYFKINRQSYYEDIKQAALKSNEIPEASHALRWNFAKRRMLEYAKAGYSYEDSLQEVSYEMKHNRAYITKHYLGG
jgi:hypothetical protein